MRISLAELSNRRGNDSSGSGGGGGGSGSNRRGGGGGGGDSSDNDLDRDRDGEVWCMQDGRIYEQGEDWEVDSCTSCTCQVSAEQVC